MKLIILLSILTITSLSLANTKQNISIEKYRNVINSKDCTPAVNDLFDYILVDSNTSTSDSNLHKASIAKQWISFCFYKQGLHQAAAFSLIPNTRSTNLNIAKKSYDLLLKITDKSKDPSLLSFALSSIETHKINYLNSEYLNIQFADLAAGIKNYERAESGYLKALSVNPSNKDALYKLGLVYLKQNKLQNAYDKFEELYDIVAAKKNNLDEITTVTLALARTLYQSKMWQESIQLYKQIPRNHKSYKQSLIELSWAQFRHSQFQAALGTVESLQNQFYENFFDPESLILRMTTQFFICQFDDYEKSKSLYQNIYFNLDKTIAQWHKNQKSISRIYKMISNAQKKVLLTKEGFDVRINFDLPYFVIRSALDSPLVSAQLSVLNQIQSEQKIFKNRAHLYNKNTSKYLNKIYSNRLKTSQKKLVDSFIQEIQSMKKTIEQYNSQFEFINYEALNSKKMNLKKLISLSEEDREKLNQTHKRSYYWENGFRYWPFKGEYWVDEIGNFQYLGINKCIYEQ